MSLDIGLAQSAADWAAWDDFGLTCPSTSFFTGSSWFNSYAPYGMQVQLLLARDSTGAVVGGAPLAIFRWGPLRWLHVAHGPAANEGSEEVVQALIEEIEAYAVEVGAVYCQIAPFERSHYEDRWQERAAQSGLSYDPELPRGALCGASALLQERGYHQGLSLDLLKVPRDGQIVPLDVEDLPATFCKQTRRKIRATQRSTEVEVDTVDSVEDLKIAYEILKENMARYGQTIRPWANFADAVQPLLEQDRAWMPIASYQGQPCATQLVIFGGGRGAAVMAGARRVTTNLVSPAYLLQYLGMEETRRRGFPEYDLTSVVESISQYKTTFHPRYYRLVPPFYRVLKPVPMGVLLSIYPALRRNRRRVAQMVYRGRSFLGRLR